MTRLSNVFSTDLEKEYYSDEGCFITEIMNQPSISNLSLARARVVVGGLTEAHSLKNTEEIYYITQGSGIATIDGRRINLHKGDCLRIETGQVQRIENTGTVDLIFLCICLPRFEQDNYLSIK